MLLIREAPWSPAIELQETETELVLKVQLPGINPEALDIQVSENAVFLSGEYHEQSKTNEQGIFKSEFQYGQFKRVVPLHTAIRRDCLRAEMVAGLLTVSMVKINSALPNLVKVPVIIHDKSLVIPVVKDKND